MNKSFNLVLIVSLIFILGLFLPETMDSSNLSNYKNLKETFEIISELFSVFVALSIFGITWYAYDKSRDNHSLFLGIAFLFTGLLILCHLLSYPFMPDFLTPNTPQKSAIFFLESRLIMAFLLLASVFVNADSFPKLVNKYVIAWITITLFVGFLLSLLFYEDFLFGGINLDSYSLETVILLFLITIIFIATSYLYNKRAKETGQINLDYLANGSIIILVSNLVYFSYEFSGHFLIITGFFYFYLGLYKSSVEQPYEKLAISEEKLRLSAQEKYRRLFDNANDAVVTIDADGCVTSWNKSAERLFGWTVGEMTGKRLVEAVAIPETVAEKEKMLSELLPEAGTGQEMTCMCRDGTKIDVSVTISPIMDINRNITERSLIIRDITERKKFEHAMRKSEEFLKTVLNSMNDGIMVIDVHDFGIVSVNRFLLKIYGLKEEEVIGKKCFEISHKITEPCYRINEICPLLEAVETGKYSTIEHVHFGKNGEKIYVEVSTSPIKDDHGKVVQMIHLTRDITERRVAEEAHRESEERFRKVFEDGLIGMVLTSRDFKFFSANPAFCQMLGYTQEEMSIRTFLDVTHPEQRRTDFENVEKLWRGEIPNYRTEKRYITKNGDICWGSLSASLIRGRDGKPLYVLAMVENITKRKFAEEKIKKSLDEKEVLLREIHHRVKNNMQIVSSLLMLQSQNIEEKKYKDIFIESQTRIQSMALIHEKLYESESIAQIDFKEYINDIISNIFESYCIKSNIKIDMNIESIPITIDHAVPCGLIINELVTNSLKYAFPGDRQGSIQISLKSKDNNMIQLSISDDGIGIPKDLDIRNTRSLGLHLVTALAEGQLHGRIILNRDRGTEFQISFGAT